MPIWLRITLVLTGVALIQASLRRALLAPLRGVVWLADRAAVWLASLAQRLAAAAGRRLTEIELDRGRWRAAYALGALLSVIACTLFVGAEGMTIALSLQALGLAAVHLPPALAHVDAMLTGSLLLAGVYAAWAAHALAAGPSLLIVRHWHSQTALLGLRRMAKVAFAAVMIATLGLGTLRARELVRSTQASPVTADTAAVADTTQQTSTSPDPVVSTVRYVVSIAGAGALMCVSAVAWALGPAQLLPLLSLLLVWMAVPPIGIARWIAGAISALARAANTLFAHLIDMIMAVATLLVRAPVELARTIHGWAAARKNGDDRTHPIKATIASMTTVAWDMQLPARAGTWMAATTTKTDLE